MAGVTRPKPNRMKGSQYTVANITLVSTDITNYR
jgi:hypothetical protein